jgi:rod shape-determining protein MreC
VLSFVRRHREPLLVCLILAHALGMFLGSSRRVRDPNLVDRIALAVTAPVQRAAVAAVDGTVNGWQQYVSLRNVRRDKARLLEENAKLRADVVGLAEARAENERLRRLVHYDGSARGRRWWPASWASTPTPTGSRSASTEARATACGVARRW